MKKTFFCFRFQTTKVFSYSNFTNDSASPINTYARFLDGPGFFFFCPSANFLHLVLSILYHGCFHFIPTLLPWPFLFLCFLKPADLIKVDLNHFPLPRCCLTSKVFPALSVLSTTFPRSDEMLLIWGINSIEHDVNEPNISNILCFCFIFSVPALQYFHISCWQRIRLFWSIKSMSVHRPTNFPYTLWQGGTVVQQ